VSAPELPFLWLLARSTGIVSLVFLTGAVVLGIAAGSRTPWVRWPRFVTQGLHRTLALTGVTLLVVHVVAVVVDAHVDLSVLDAFVPFRAGYEPFWVGLGALAVDLFVLVVATSLVRDRLGLRTWRAVHLSSYAAWAVSVVHGLGLGTDTANPVFVGLCAVSFGAVAASVVFRLVRRPARRRGTLQPGPEVRS
jgi:sulfoxide reductase heme-binding subunit YedZ